MYYRKLDVDDIVTNYEKVNDKKCPKCGKPMIPLGDTYIDPYFYCFDCEVELPR